MQQKCNHFCVALVFLSFALPGVAQDIEPRRCTPLPVGMNVLGAGFVLTSGDIRLDPVLELEDLTVDTETAVVSYQHAFDLAGQSTRFDVRQPFQDARWEGFLAADPASAKRQGSSDPRFRFSVNFVRAPALNGKQFRA
jgi:hypothetical protein